MTTLLMYGDSTDKVIAESPDDAMALWAAQYGMSYTEETGCGPDEWLSVPADKPVTLCFPDDANRPSETRSAAEWIASKGRCWFGSTEY